MKRGFTLIELLVVITIIVVLLALLTPALDKAIYQAELMSCGAKLRSISSGAMIYANNFKRRYPYRPMVELYTGMEPMGWLNNGLDNQTSGAFGQPGRADDRTVFRDYIPVNASLNCPLIADLDIANSRVEPLTTYTYSQYNLYFGFYYRGMKGMRKLGDRLAANEWLGKTQKSYRLIASDFSMANQVNNFGFSGHPDRDGAWPEYAYQDETNPWDGSYPITLAWYYGFAPRGELDLNFAYDDGSVTRIDRVEFFPEAEDPRVDYIPAATDESTKPDRTYQVPAGQ